MSKRYPGGVIRKTPATPTQASASGVWNMTDVTQAQQTNNWPVANVPNPMSRSLRFRSSATAYLNRTPAVATNRKTYTWSGWVKMGKLTNTYGRSILFCSTDNGGANNFFSLSFETNSGLSGGYAPLRMLQYTSGAKVLDRQSTSLYRDPAAWYHVVMAVDMTQSTATNRQRVYVNGVEVTAWTNTTTLAQNTDTWINYNQSHQIGIWTDDTGTAFDGYMAEVNFVDGQQLAPTAFGQYDQFSNWTSKQYTGTYGTNGFYLPFKNNSSTGTLGLDFSGNNNTWTTNNFSVTPSYQYTTYTSGTGTYTVPSNVTSINYLVVAGGGGGYSGGGGAGGLLQGTMSVTPGQTIAYSIGAGGTGGNYGGGVAATNGSNTTFGALTAIGGGAGTSAGSNGTTGGSGSGGAGSGSGTTTGGAGTSGQGFAGGGNAGNIASPYPSGGGGGAGATGANAANSTTSGAGGAGLTWINGSTYSGGGGGGTFSPSNPAGAGGAGGGGAGGSTGNGTAGTANTGGGGGGSSLSFIGGAGGSGVIIIANAVGNTTYDSMTDVPTQWTPYNVTGDVGGIVRGNYCVFNPLNLNLSAGSIGLSNGNLTKANNGNGAIGTILVSTDKYYCELTYTAISGTVELGVCDNEINLAVGYKSDGTKDVDSFSTNSSYGASYTTNDVIGIALDATNKTVTFYKNGASQGAVSYTRTGNLTFFMTGRGAATYAGVANFGQYAFTYAPPSGFKSLCTTNLPTPTIQQGNLVMNATTYTGTGNGVSQTIINAGSAKPDLVWVKSRSGVADNVLFDSIRGFGGNKELASNNTQSEGQGDTSSYGYVSAANSNGFTVTAGSVNAGYVNSNGATYVGWQWQAGQGTTSSNTSGSITSTVSVNASAGFSVVTFAASASNTVGHGLGVAPSVIFIKSRTYVNDWICYHSALGATKYVSLNLASAASTNSVVWNNTAPTSSVFTIGSGFSSGSYGNCVAYCWSEIAGFSKFGSYVGNGSTDGAFAYTGFRPKFVMVKEVTSGSNWFIQDTTVNTYNVVGNVLLANQSIAELSGTYMDILSNGFKLRTTSSGYNDTGLTYIYMAFAEYPFKSALAR